jgi:GNAT superfamily N-acetyltransferase
VSARLEVRRAGVEDVDEIVGVLSEAAGWLLARGIRQWPDPFPRERVSALVARGDFYLASLEGETVATLALMWSDPTFWGERPPEAGYVHALAVRPAHAGQGVGASLLDWAGEQVAAAGREYLRLDCLAGNAKLRRYYERRGFELRGEVAVDDFSSALYERRCSRTTTTGEAGTGADGEGDPGMAGDAVVARVRKQPEPSSGPVETSAQTRHEAGTDTRRFRGYARSGSEGGPPTPPIEGGGAVAGYAFAGWVEFAGGLAGAEPGGAP